MTTPPAATRALDPGLVAGTAVLVFLVALSAGTRVPLVAVFAASAVVASLMTTARRTAYVGAAAVGCGVLSASWFDASLLDYAVRVALCFLLSLVAVQGAALRQQREGRLERMTVIAETAQRAVLRSLPAQVGPVGVAARYVSATAEAMVGGDLYEVAPTPYGVRVVIGDVRGKGLEAVQTAASVLGAFRATAYTEPDLAALARGVDATLQRLVAEEDFVTAVVGELDGHTVRLANCGHHPPVVVAGGRATVLDTGEPTLPLGLGADPEVTEHPWPAGARLLLYTDGLVEARDRAGRFFALADHADQITDGDLEEALDRLAGQVRRHAGGRLRDDLALLLVEHREE